MEMRYPVLGLALLAGAVCGAQPSSIAQKTAESVLRPIATIQSSKGLLVNGTQTPPGVNSVIVAPGDVIGTMDAQAVMRFSDRTVVTLLPTTTYKVPGDSRAPLVPIGKQPIKGGRPMALPPLSTGKPH